MEQCPAPVPNIFLSEQGISGIL